MDIITLVDTWLLTKFTKVSHAFQKLTGKTNFFLARWAILICAGGITLDVANYFHQFLFFPTFSVMMVLGIFVIVFLLMKALVYEKEEERVYSGEKTKRIEFYALPGWRVVYFCMSVMLIPATVMCVVKGSYPLLEVLRMGILPCAFLSEYFLAVTPLPPCRGKIVEFFCIASPCSTR